MESISGDLAQFWELVREVWDSSAFGLNIGRLLTALLILFVFWVLRGLFVRTILALLHRWVKKTENDFDDQLLDAVKDPIALLPIILGLFLALDYLELEGAYLTASNNLVKSLIAFALFWSLHRCVKPVSLILAGVGRMFTTTMLQWMTRSIRWLFIFLGAATILEIWGIQVGPLLAGLGLFGVAVALGAQDLFRNLIAGLMILFEQRFHVGDWIKIEGVVEGTVEKINFRSTTVRRFDKAPVYVPNTEFSDGAVINFSSMTHRRIYWMIGLEYRTTIEQLRKIRDDIEDYVLNNDDYAKPPQVATFVRIDKFSDSSIDVMLYCFTKTTDWGKWLEIKEQLAYKIKDIVEGAGSGFAFPSQSLYIESMPENVPETFQPPQN